LTDNEAGGVSIVYNTFRCNSYIVYNLYALPAGKPFMGVGTGLSTQYPQKNPYPWSGYGFLPGTGVGTTSGIYPCSSLFDTVIVFLVLM
jgi:hypothetical protein